MQQENMEQENVEKVNMEQENVKPEVVEEEIDPTVKFIEIVKEHICLWDMQSEEYYNKKLYRLAWKSVLELKAGVPLPHPPRTPEQKADIKMRVAELKKEWVELRDSYYKNEDPGKKYKDKLRFLHTVYQSREMEAVLEFDEPSWDLMDLRTWTVLKTHIPRRDRLTDPAPEYELTKSKKVKLSTDEAKKSNQANVADKEKAAAKENAPDNDKATDAVNAADKNIATDKENTANKENAANNEKETDKVNAAEKVTDKETGTDKENTTDKENSTDKDNTTGSDNATGSDNTTGKEKPTGKKKNEASEKKLSILEKAMTLYELDYPGVWSSDEDEAVKAARTYVDNTSQTDETEEYPNMPPVPT